MGKSKSKKSGKSLNGWNIVFRYLLEYRQEVILLSVLGVISALANGSIPYIIGKFFDAILNPARVFVGTSAEMPLWILLLILWGVAQLFANSVDWINDKKSRKMGLSLYTGYISKVYSYLLKLPISFHKNEKTGEISEKMQRAGNAISSIIEQIILRLAPQILSIVVGLSIAFFIQPLLALILVAGISLYIMTLFKIVPPIVDLQKKGQKAWGRAYGHAYGAITNINAIKRFTAEDYEVKRIHHNFVKKGAGLWFKVESIWSAINFYQRVIIVLTQISIFIFAVHFIQNGVLTIGELIALNAYAAMIFGPFMFLGRNWQVIQSGLVALERSEGMLDIRTENYSPLGEVELKKIEGDVEFRDVSFSYDKKGKQILNNINMEVRAGDVVALVGESGVGKSTLVDLVSGYYFADSGSVLIDGVDIKKINLTFLRKNIAIVPQEIALFNDSIKNNIRYGNFKVADDEIKRVAREAHVDVFVKKFPKKYNQVVGERGVKLSVGEKQRVAIARAILRDPKILVLDEPTSALDVETENFIQESFGKLMKGRTTFIVAHRLSTVRKADKIFVFKEGKIVEQGKHDELIKIEDGAYRRLYDLHIGLE